MKLSYECWRRQLRMQDLFYSALKETLSEMRLLALYKLQRLVAKIAPTEPEPDDSESHILSNLLGSAGDDVDHKLPLQGEEDSAFADCQIRDQNDRFLSPKKLRATTVAQRFGSKRKQ